MGSYDSDSQTSINYSSITKHKIDTMNVDSVGDQEETISTATRWSQDWGYFNRIPKLKSAIIMKAIWTCGKGYVADTLTGIKLEKIIGNGKQTFKDILFNLIVVKQIGGDAFAEIIRDPDTDDIINLKIIDPSNFQIIYGRNGMIKRYEQVTQKGLKKTFKPKEIFHLSHNNFAGEMRGRSIPEMCEKIIIADDENFNIMQKLTRFQAVPFIVFKVKTDNAASIAKFKDNIKTARTSGDDLIVPDDENILSWEVVQVSPSAILMDWRNSINN